MKTRPYSVRLPVELIDKFNDWIDKNQKSPSKVIEKLIKDELQDWDIKKAVDDVRKKSFEKAIERQKK